MMVPWLQKMEATFHFVEDRVRMSNPASGRALGSNRKEAG